MSPVIETRGLGRVLPGDPPVTLVSSIDLKIEPGSFTAVVGPSGCGKSSLLYLLGLLDRPTAGEILIDGRDIAPLDGDARSRLRLARFGFVFQFHFLLPEFSALENVKLPMRRLARLTAQEIDERASSLLSATGIDAETARRTPSRLSGGQRQRVAIARAIANDPAVVLGDEPTGNLDSSNSERVIAMLGQLARDEGRAVVCVTHDPKVAAAADRRIHMLDGRIGAID